VKVLVPDVPTADEIMPYLRKIDENKWYSNTGPLVKELESRMGGVTVSSATLGLELAAKVTFKKLRVRIPAFTFVATATALLRAGFQPVLCDVGDYWSLKDIDDQSLPVCPFGAGVTAGGLVDAASAWGNQHHGNRVFSLHATKALPAGEGGLVCGNSELLERVRRLANFGLEPDRYAHGIVTEAGTNAKLSEYHAAVALAALDRWPKTAAIRRRLHALYVERLPEIERQPRAEGVYTTFPILVKDAAEIARLMAEKGIETRRWYTPTLERHPAFANLPREGGLKNCQRLNDELLCLPFHAGITESDVDQVCEVLRWAITKSAAAHLSTSGRTSSAKLKLVKAQG
jgi:dTDP-4-amino-4,6-dideoxygalactose transaminase